MPNCDCCGSVSVTHHPKYYTGSRNPSLRPTANLCDECWEITDVVMTRLHRMVTLAELKSEYDKSKKEIKATTTSASSSSASTSSATSVSAKSEEKKVVAVEQKEQKDNWTIVRIWLPRRINGEFCVAHSAENVGHTSLETKEIYASFWPDWEAETMKKNTGNGYINALLGTAKGACNGSLDRDIKGEAMENLNEKERQPDVVVILYSLNVEKINKSFMNFQESKVSDRWSLGGRNMFNKFNNDAGQSCSGLVYDLLEAGGIFKLDYPFDITRKFVIAPDGIAKIVVRASEYEKDHRLQGREPIQSEFGTFRTKIPNIDLNFHKWVKLWWGPLFFLPAIGRLASGASFEPKNPTYKPQ